MKQTQYVSIYVSKVNMSVEYQDRALVYSIQDRPSSGGLSTTQNSISKTTVLEYQVTAVSWLD